MDFVRKRKSNEVRLQAMQERMKSVRSINSLISASLKGDNNARSHHITFESDSESDSNGNYNETTKITKLDCNGNTKRNDIFREIGTNSKIGDYKFPDKPQFEGRIGARLFKLQRQAGNDDRFKMDERFIDSSSENSELETESRADNELEEKQKYLKILGEVLGKDVRIEKKQSQEIKNVIRFDPTQESHRKYILQKDEKGSPTKIEEITTKEVDQFNGEGSDPIPKISSDTFYECQNEVPISSLFENTQDTSEKEEALFNFQIQTSDFFPPLLPYNAEGMEEGSLPGLLDTEQHFVSDNNGGEEAIDVPEKTQPDPDRINSLNLFFFHANNAKLRNRIDEAEFYRHQDLDTLNREWYSKAVSLMHDCKRKHRDAVRWRKKSLSSK